MSTRPAFLPKLSMFHRQSLYVKLAVPFLCILLFVGAAQLYITARLLRPLVAEIEQQINWSLATNIAEKLQPTVKNSFDIDVVEKKLYDLSLMNPKVEIYILDGRGVILVDMAPESREVVNRKVDLRPIKQALREDFPDLPIYGPDPRSLSNESRAISVAPLTVSGKEAYVYVIIEGQRYYSLLITTGQFYLLSFAITGILLILSIAAAFGFLFFSYLTRHFRVLTHTVGKYQEGNFSERINVNSEDEIGQLSTAVNEMADTIVAMTDELKEVDKVRRELVANISHDLRSPLTSIQGFLETMIRKEDQLSKDDREHYLGIIHSSVQVQSQLVSDLFELSKLDAREKEPEMEAFCIAELVQDVVLKFKPQAEKNNISLDFALNDSPGFVIADITMIERVLINLITNSIRYAGEHGKVLIEVSPGTSGAKISVSDTGIGIAEADLPYIFDTFYRVDKDRSRKTGGTGLGLAIVKRILELHQREIQVESEQGKGTNFYFELERETSASAA